MSVNTTCAPCREGDHEHHYYVVAHGPEDGVGGAVCTCKGECKDRTLEDRLRDFGIDPDALSEPFR